jgi:aminopeptidase N
VLLSNGDPVATRALGAGRVESAWRDPHPKPTYLFALVAGDLQVTEASASAHQPPPPPPPTLPPPPCSRVAPSQDVYAAARGPVALRVFCSRQQDVRRCAFALRALRRAFEFDARVFGREYDLGVFNVVAVDDFNMGAMEVRVCVCVCACVCAL